MGGRFVCLFAREHPAEVAGMVLVDAEHEDGLFMVAQRSSVDRAVRGVDASPRQRASRTDLVRLSTRSGQIVVDDSDHEIHLFRPDVVIQTIEDVQKGK
jgi:pimeloyl-ACP methyl ester carboxylesterase